MDNLHFIPSIINNAEDKLCDVFGYSVRIKIVSENDVKGMPNYIIIDAFVNASAASEQVSVDDIKSARRMGAEICDLRHTLWLILNTEANISLVEIAAYFNRHHTTIISGIKYIGNIIDTEETARLKYTRLSNIGEQFFQLKKYFK